MSTSLVILILVSVIWLFAQFGQRMSASNAFSWWLASLFLVIATISPTVYRPIADFLGIETISNFVLAALSFFIFCNMIELTASHTKVERKFRKFVSANAVDDYSHSHNHARSIEALVVMPCYNEEAVISEITQRIQRVCSAHPHIDFCVINDGSTDSTETILRAVAGNQFATHKVNIGVAGALLTGFGIAKARGAQFVVQCDSDGQHPIEQIPSMLSQAKEAGADLLIGSRFVPGLVTENFKSTTSLRFIGSRMIGAMLRFFCRGVGDPTSGFRVYSQEAVNILMKNMPDEYPEPESIALLAVAKAKLVETGVSMDARKGGISSIGGVKSSQYMLKVFSALLGLRMRSLFGAKIL